MSRFIHFTRPDGRKVTSLLIFIAGEIDELVDIYLKTGQYYLLDYEKGNTPKARHINNGYCGSFAYDLGERLKKQGVEFEYFDYRFDNPYKGIPHCFLGVYNELYDEVYYYDCEVKVGIRDWKMLPVYR